MLKVYFDTNIYSHIESMKECLDLILLRTEQGKIGVHFTIVNMWEIVRGITEKTLQEFQQKIKLAWKITGKGHVLTDPWQHVQRNVKLNFLIIPEPPSADFVKILREITFAKSTKQIEQIINPLKISAKEFVRNWTKSMQKIKEKTIQTLNIKYPTLSKKERASKFLSEPVASHLRAETWANLIRRYRLPSEATLLDWLEAYNLFPSIRYKIDVWMSYLWKIYHEGKEPDVGDYFDLEQVIYLDAMDYYISNDGSFLSLLKRSGNLELQNRCISLDEFCQMLSSENIPPSCAPLTSNKIPL